MFYFVNQRAYLVESAREGLPVLDTEVDASTIEYAGSHHNSWWFRGELPLEAEFATPLVDYRLKRVPQPYGERGGEVQYDLNLSWEKVLREVIKNKPTKKDWLVVGWVHGGQVKSIQAMQPSEDWISQTRNSQFLVPESEKSGIAILWQLRLGNLVERTDSSQWAWVIERSVPLSAGDEALALDEQKRGDIFYAAANGMLEEARSLLEADKKLVQARDESEYLPIRYAVENGRSEMVQLLLEFNSKIVDGWGDLNSAVMLAATNGHFDVVRLLMPERPKNSTGKWHCSWAASEALNENYEDIVEYLMRFKPNIDYGGTDKKKVVFNKLYQGYPELGFSLMDRYKIDATFEVDGYTAMHSVSGYADDSLLEKLSSLGVDSRKMGKDGKEPLDFALGNGNVEAICWLIDRRDEGIDEETLARSFAYAIDKGRMSSVECLLGYGYDVNVKIRDELTPLVLAIVRREYDIASLLLEKGATIDASGMYFDTALARLIEGDRVDLLGAFAGQGLDWNHRVFGELSIKSAAEAVGAAKVLNYLEEGGIEAGVFGEVHSVSQVSEKPKLFTPIAVDYSDELRARYGSRTELVSIVISGAGQPLFVIPDNKNLPRELFRVIEHAVVNLRFAPATMDGEAVSVALRTRIPLKADFELEKVFSLSDVDEKPNAIKMFEPLYPYSMQQSRTRGEVVVEFTLMPNGSVRDARPLRSTNSAFEKPAVVCVLQSLWQPALMNGKPVACRVRIPIKFSPR
ncbi:TonB family C-terminal domain protein [Verrucomicrobiia bacterium DG1235]|nr:TonB family C-terminal domain protein [Verrucomicrobiae bacterium DG1235]